MHTSGFLAAAFGLAALFASVQGATGQDRRWETDILRDTFSYGANTPSDVPWDEVQQGCGRRDCIPSIDAPRFVAAGRAGFLAEDDLVLGIVVNGDARAYPVAILNYHEIVNDVIGGLPVAITYCPLCGSGVAFEREPLHKSILDWCSDARAKSSFALAHALSIAYAIGAAAFDAS